MTLMMVFGIPHGIFLLIMFRTGLMQKPGLNWSLLISYREHITVTLTQDCDPLSDFLVDFDFSWDSEGSYSAMQRIILSLFDSNGEKIASVGYNDAWVRQSGEIFAAIGRDTFTSGYNTLPFADSAAVDIVQYNGDLNILWNDINLLTGASDAPFSSVSLAFSYYPYSGGSIFGTESVDLIADPPSDELEPPVPTPEPGTMLLIGLGLLGSFIGRKIYSKKL